MSTINDPGPLDWRVSIVDKQGRPSPEFQRRWNTNRTNTAQIGSITFGTGAPPADPAPTDGAEYYDTTSTPFVAYVGQGGVWNLASPEAANPTATAGVTAVSGTAHTFMRSDAAPAVQIATTGQFGIVKPDGTTIDVSGGEISVPTATTAAPGLVKPDGTTIDISSGVISVPTATTSQLGLVKPDGSTITISGAGVISSSGGGGGGGGNGEAPWTVPNTSAFTLRTGSTGVITNQSNGVLIQAIGTNFNTNELYYCIQTPTPGASGWQATGRFKRHTPLLNWGMFGMLRRQSSAGTSVLYSLGNDSTLGINRNQFNSDTSWNSVSTVTPYWYDLDFWMRIHDDLTNITVYMSKDGYFWQSVYVENRNTWCTADQVGFHINPNFGNSPISDPVQNVYTGMTCLSWKIDTLS